MSPVLKLSVRPTLFDPIQVDIDGEILNVKLLTLGDLEEIQELGKSLNAGSAAAIRQVLETRLEGKIDLLKSLPLPEIKKLIEFVVEKMLTPSTEEKNGQGPGQEKSLE